MANRPGKKEIKKVSTEKNDLVNETVQSLISGETLKKETKNKVQIMLRLEADFGEKVKEKAKSLGLPTTKYIELLIRNDLTDN